MRKRVFELIWNSDPDAAAVITALLQEAKANTAVLDSFTSHDFGACQSTYHISRWAEQQRKGRNLWRLKIWELQDQPPFYRVVYAFHPQEHIHYILGVFDRDSNYDENDARTQRVLAVYDRLDIPIFK